MRIQCSFMWYGCNIFSKWWNIPPESGFGLNDVTVASSSAAVCSGSQHHPAFWTVVTSASSAFASGPCDVQALPEVAFFLKY